MNNNEERYNYIILDRVGVYSWDGTDMKATWNIPFHYFTEYEDNDDVYIQLENCTFNALTTIMSSTTCTIFMENLSVINQKNTDTASTILGIIPCALLADNPADLATTDYFLSPSNVDCNNMKLKVGRFQRITIQVLHEGDVLSMDGDPYRFILKVSYKKRN